MTLDADDKEALAKIAREALKDAVVGKSRQPSDPGREALLERRGCFVTLKTGGRLRGCLGCFVSDQPLYRTVAEYAAYSATEDPRFAGDRLRPDDLPDVGVEVSVLAPLEPCPEPEKIVLGKHGIYVRADGRSGCFLPQVATEMRWGLEEFWGRCCRDKAGLPWNAWRDPKTELMTFTTETFDA